MSRDNNLRHREKNAKSNGPHAASEDIKYHKVDSYRRSGLNRLLFEVFMPILLFISIPLMSITIWYICAKFNGDLKSFAFAMHEIGSAYDILDEIIICRLYVTKFSALVIGSFFIWSIVLTLLLPGKYYNGNITVNGNMPTYKENGFSYHIVTTVVYFALASYLETVGYSVAVLYDKYDEILITLNIFGSLFCWFLYFKGMQVFFLIEKVAVNYSFFLSETK
jgi:hypothetical protein